MIKDDFNHRLDPKNHQGMRRYPAFAFMLLEDTISIPVVISPFESFLSPRIFAAVFHPG